MIAPPQPAGPGAWSLEPGADDYGPPRGDWRRWPGACILTSVQILRSFIEEQDQLGRVERISDEVDPGGEASKVLAARQGRIVVLERVRGYRAPVVSGLVGSRELLAAAIGTSVADLVTTLAARMDAPGTVEVVDSAPFLEGLETTTTVDDVVPLLRFDPGSERPYTSSSIIVARWARGGVNLSFHRMMYLGSDRFSVRVVPRHLRTILDEAGGKARVAVVMGVHPAVCIAAATSGGPDFDELAFAASICGGLRVVDLDGLLVPADAEIVLEARFTGDLAPEGPFVDLTGTLDGVRQQPVLEVTRILHRPDFLYHTIVPGGAEHRLLMGTPQEPRILRAVSNAFPRVRQVALTAGGCNWLHAAISLDRPLPGQARNAALAALGAHPSLKRVVVVDADIDVHDAEQVEWAIATRVQPDRDVIVVPGTRGSSLDPARNPADSTTAKWIIDATVPADRDRAEFLRAEDLPR